MKNNTMFTIDLLKGHGVPPKSGPMGLLIILITILIPAALALTLYGLYHNNKVVTNIKQQNVLKIEEDISELSESLKNKRELDQKKYFYNTCLSEVKTSMKKYKQWSPVLALLLEEMPSSVVLNSIKVEQERVAKNTSGPIDLLNSEKVIITKLVLEISKQDQGDYAEQVKDFRNRLYASSSFGSKLDNIVFSREAGHVNGVETISYKIECLFKPGI